jgi:REP element-mobilizing transposase RayT
MLRGNGGQPIFFADADRYRLYLLLQEGVERYGHRIHAFCLMSNYLHLAMQMAEVSLSKILQNLSFRYTRWVNRQQGRMGHLFQGRYKALLVDADSVDEPSAYPWSGHRAYLGEEILPWLTTDLTSAETLCGVCAGGDEGRVSRGVTSGRR